MATDQTNWLLGDLRRSIPSLALKPYERVTLFTGEVVWQPGTPLRHVYFPIDCVISLCAEAGRPVEVALFGRGDMLGTTSPPQKSRVPFRATVTKSGEAWRIQSSHLRLALRTNDLLKSKVDTYAFALLGRIAQSAACTCFHALHGRLARYILVMADRAQSETFYLTHALLAQKLGVRRSGVTRFATDLQRRKFIRYSRGRITIVNRTGLERCSCDCYARSLHGKANRVSQG